LKLYTSDAVYLATAIVEHGDLFTDDKYLLSKHEVEYAEKEGIHILALE